jgi:hypothetical protein
MAELNDLEKQLMEDLVKDPAMLHNFFIDYKDKIDDLRLVKNIINKMMVQIGYLNKDGTFRENISITKVSQLVMQANMQPKKFKKEMSFIGDIMPLIQKYKDL